MSVLRANIYSRCLYRNVMISVIMPIENEMPEGGYKSLYLLNGYMGDDLDWLMETKIKRLALKNNVAVIMPAGENGFYVDDPDGRRNYGQYVGQELVTITRKMFPLSTKREDTMIAGLSMGGFGALRNGLKYNQTFGTVGSFSLGLANELSDIEGSVSSDIPFIEKIFGLPIKSIIDSNMDPRYILKQMNDDYPRMYISCGTEDYVFHCSELVHEALVDGGIEHTYITKPGRHTWDFWNDQIEAFFEWL